MRKSKLIRFLAGSPMLLDDRESLMEAKIVIVAALLCVASLAVYLGFFQGTTG
jgi:hypothetical protein